MSERGPTREELTEDPRVWMNAEIDRLRAERDDLRAELVRAERRQTVYLDLNAQLREALHALGNPLGWLADNYPAAMEAMPREHFAAIRQADAVLAGEGGPAAEEPAS